MQKALKKWHKREKNELSNKSIEILATRLIFRLTEKKLIQIVRLEEYVFPLERFPCNNYLN